MKLYTTTDGYADTIDLEDVSIYLTEWQEMPIHDLFYLAWSKAGRSIIYMKYFWPHMDDGGQWFRVDRLIRELVGFDGRKRYEEKDRLELMGWLFRFDDEVENQC